MSQMKSSVTHFVWSWSTTFMKTLIWAPESFKTYKIILSSVDRKLIVKGKKAKQSLFPAIKMRICYFSPLYNCKLNNLIKTKKQK